MRKILYAIALSAAVSISAPSSALATDEAGSSADNTRQNKEMQGKTAEQQKETPEDRKITQKIRKALVKDDTLSTYAHNVKIITRNGKVTLKGPVRSEEEKVAVQKAAAKVVGAGSVSNKLQIAPDKEE